jgi:hypothetical protein
MRAAVAILTLASATLASPAEPPYVVAVLLDTSGSLRPEDLDRARTLAVDVLERLDAGSEVAVFTFDDEARLVLPRTSSPDAVRRALEAAARQGRFTALHDALYDASRYLREGPGARRAILLLTDGRDENSALNLDDGLKVAQEAGMPVFAVGLGRAEERVLRRIAKLTAGGFARGEDARAETLVAQMAAAPVTAAASPPAGAPVSPPASPASTPLAGPTSAPPSADGRVWWLLAGLALATSLVLFALVWRRKSAPGTAGGSDITLQPGLSATVLTRRPAGDEPVEKTVMLRHRSVLTITKGPGLGQLFELNAATTTSLGRARANDVVLPDVSVSSEHCRIRPEDGRYVLHDLKSTNGTFVNERRVERHALADGDVVQIGETYLEFRTEHQQQ